MNGYSNESGNNFLHQVVILTDSVLSAAFSWIASAVATMFTKISAGGEGVPGPWLTIGPAVGAGAALQGMRGSEQTDRDREDNNV